MRMRVFRRLFVPLTESQPTSTATIPKLAKIALVRFIRISFLDWAECYCRRCSFGRVAVSTILSYKVRRLPQPGQGPASHETMCPQFGQQRFASSSSSSSFVGVVALDDRFLVASTTMSVIMAAGTLTSNKSLAKCPLQTLRTSSTSSSYENGSVVVSVHRLLAGLLLIPDRQVAKDSRRRPCEDRQVRRQCEH